MISIFLADDHPIILHGLRDLFGAFEDLRVVGEEPDSRIVVDAVSRLRPDVLVLDLMMPHVSGFEIIRQVRQRATGTGIVVLSMHSNPGYAWEALRNGALGYVQKCVLGDELVAAVRAAAAGRRHISPPLSEADLEEYAQRARQQGPDPVDMLTDRERQVFRLAATGMTSAEIAADLRISVRTIESHRANLLRKLGLRNQTELVRYAIQRGVILPD